MKRKIIFILILLIFSLKTLVAKENYYIEITCNTEQETEMVKSLLKSQHWLDVKNKICVVDNTKVLLGPYPLNLVNEIKDSISEKLNLPANIYVEDLKTLEMNDENFVSSEENSLLLEETELSESSKELTNETINSYNDEKIRKIISYAMELYTTPYKWGGVKIEEGVDCSYFTKYVFSKFGVKLPRTAREQYKIGKPVDKKELRCGDLVFFKKVYYRKYKGKVRRYEYINHVGIYLTNGEFIHATRGERKVTISSLESGYYKKNYAGARRIIEN